MEITNKKNHSGFVLLLLVGLLFTVLPAGAAETYKIDPDHTSLVFNIDHFGVGQVYGLFTKVSGSFSVDEANPANSWVKLEARADSIFTGVAKRDQHLKSPDFLNAKRYPLLKFESASARKVNDSTAEVTGKLSVHGVTREITVLVKRIGSGKDPYGNQRLGVKSEFTLKRSDFGIKFMTGDVGDDVRVILTSEGILVPGE